MFKCDKCNIDFDNNVAYNNHLRFHNKYDNIKDNIIDDYINNNLTFRELISKYNSNNLSLIKILKDIKVDITEKKRKRNTLSHKHSDETKSKLSEIRKKWLMENPDKHVWKTNDKFISKPCEFLKKILIENNITFVSEYSISGRYYSIDIAFPDKKVGLEVNGNQHYNSDGTLKTYYKNKNDFFIENGWIIYQIHYTKVYNEIFIYDLINKLKNEYNLEDIDYSFYLKNKIKKYYYCNSCKINKVSQKGVDCLECSKIKRRKVKNRPDKNELLKMIQNIGLEGVGRKYGVSGNAVKKWIKTYDEFKK